jgi:ribosomal protein S18 acetylase RimI-like enzyme
MTLRELTQSAGFRLTRALLSLRRRSAGANANVLRARGENAASLRLREALETDIPALADLHVRTWNDAYAPIMKGPPVAVREAQWREAFAKRDRSWFCVVAERPNGELVAFAKGVFRDNPDDAGELNKLYVQREYQRLGVGRRLVGVVVRRFLDRGVSTMTAYVDPRNPSCGFFERLGARWLRENGSVNFSWYVWNDLNALADQCPVE